MSLEDDLDFVNYFKGRDIKYKDAYHDEYGQNAHILLEAVKSLLTAIEWTKRVVITSGWRPPNINAVTPHAAPKSLHTTGQAVDLHDTEGELFTRIYDNASLLKYLDLWMEDRSATPTWVHLDMGNRPGRSIRIFNP